MSSSDLETKTSMEYDPSKDEKNVDVCETKGLDEDDDRTIVLKSSDEKSFTLSMKAVKVSMLVSQALENDQAANEVPIPGAKGSILELVIQYMVHHNGTEPPIIEKPLRSKIMKDVCKDKWDAEFIDTIGPDRQKLYDLILAANYMDVKSLLHLGCAKVASLIKGQPLEKIKDILAVNQTGNKSDSKDESKDDASKAQTENVSTSTTSTTSVETTAVTTEAADNSASDEAGVDVTMHTSS